jgi:selenocysteine lyase/cysteine desulfurase
MSNAPTSALDKIEALPPTVRGLFPGACTSTYLDVASRGLIPGSAMDIVTRRVRDRVFGMADKNQYFQSVENCRGKLAQLISAKPNEIAITKNVSEGLNAIAASINWKPGDEVFYCASVEHPNNVYTWRNLTRLGVVVRDFPAPDGVVPIEEMLRAVSPRTRVITVSATTFQPGFRTDLDQLGNGCRARGVRLVVDAAQSIGITHLDITNTNVDAVAASSQKGLCALYGFGFLYVKEEFANSLHPVYLARFGVDFPGDSHEADYNSGEYKLRSGALRFDLGNYNFLAAELAASSLDILLTYGTKRIDAHVTALAEQFVSALKNLGIAVADSPKARRASIVCVRTDAGAVRGSVEAVHTYLQSKGIRCAPRRGFLRFSFHLYNNPEDVETTVAALKGWISGPR